MSYFKYNKYIMILKPLIIIKEDILIVVYKKS